MSRVILSPKAKSDLSRIWDFSLERWGLEQAEKYVRELWSAMEEQSGDLTKSVDISDVRKGYRKIRVGAHVIFFKAISDGIDVVRILHQQMDFERHL